MERLTTRKNSIATVSGAEDPGFATQFRLQEVLERLARYEDTGLEPEEIKKKEVAEWKDRYRDGDLYCTGCGAILEEDEKARHFWRFCYACGRRMRNVPDK